MNILITGASQGIGFAVAEIFAKKGNQVWITSRNEVRLYQALETLQTQYPDAAFRAKAFDLSVKEQAIALGNWALGHGTPDILVNNAGLFEPGNVTDEPDGALESQMATNLYSAYHLTRTILPAMKEKRRGFIFNICSVAGLQAYPGGGAYSISKFALNGFSQNLREELKPHGIKVAALFPGAVKTASWGDFDNSEKRIMEAADIAVLIETATRLSDAACVESIILRPQLGDL
ncbi:SDR family oxidoreductase [Niabella drilacis]|uniref:Short-chain dehydrogenase n=1 Tax=Niabella drilacis (strain DSM 25811 / CCM 8410 / CCUG 62505 / LMG 26954 / E90) TaxID=1285928 RepID=A0A1G7BS90_NIADE|nr:SDR family oxidoreductase [Niabella drilacis]SDE29939.1 Short-chain dehydrogenase [Niabella drilacis]